MMETIIFITLASALLFLTVSGGGLFPITVAIVALVTGTLACLVTCRTLQPGTENSSARNLPRLEITLALLLLFILITALPLPPSWGALSGALRNQQNQAVVTSLHEAAQYGAPPMLAEPWFCLSRNRAGTLRFFLLLAAAMSAGLLAASLSARRKIMFLSFLAFTGTLVGVAGYIGQWIIPQGDTLWWFIPIPHAPTTAVGCFLNRNHFAGFVAMLCPVALALTADALTRRCWVSAFLHLIFTGLLATAVYLSLSRGAMVAMIIGLVATSLMIAFRHRILWGILLLVFMAVGSGLLVAHSPALRERLAGIDNPTQLGSVNSRLNEWRESLRVWPHYPLIGAGANALRMVYPQYRQTSVGARLIHAENEYIQLLAECGLAGIALSFAVIWTIRQRIKHAPSPLPSVIVTSVAGALSVTAIHCIMDFPAHLPLYALVLGTLVGLLLTPPPELNRHTRWIALLPALIATVGAAFIAAYHPADVRNLDDPNYLYQAKNRDLHRALIWAPTSSAWLYLGRAMLKEGSVTQNGPLCGKAESFITRAATLDPQNYRLWYELGQVRLNLNDPQRAAEAFQKAQSLRSWLSPPAIPGSPTP